MNDSPLITIDNHKEEAFQVTWDMGPRCNYDCTYCPPQRHDNFSKHPPLEELKSTFDNILKYFNLITSYTKNEQHLAISMTGGEPTNNPALMPFLIYIKENNPDVKVGVTTNGTFSEKYCQQLIDHQMYYQLSLRIGFET